MESRRNDFAIAVEFLYTMTLKINSLYENKREEKQNKTIYTTSNQSIRTELRQKYFQIEHIEMFEVGI